MKKYGVAYRIFKLGIYSSSYLKLYSKFLTKPMYYIRNVSLKA